MWKRKKVDNFMCLLEFECVKRLKAHSRAILAWGCHIRTILNINHIYKGILKDLICGGSTITSWWCHIRVTVSLATLLFVQYFVEDYNKENNTAHHYWPLVMWIHRWLVDSPHKGPVIPKFDIWWCVDSPHKVPVIPKFDIWWCVDSPHKVPVIPKFDDVWIPLTKCQ